MSTHSPNLLLHKGKFKASVTFFDELCLIMTGFDSLQDGKVFCPYSSDYVTLTNNNKPDPNVSGPGFVCLSNS
jgi:hypothetical protein